MERGEMMVDKLLASEFFRDKNQQVALEPRAPQANFPEHTHDFDEIVIVTSGLGRHIINGYPQSLHLGTVLYIDAKDHHLYENVNNLHLTNILFQSYNFKYINNIGKVIRSIKDKKGNHQLITKNSIDYLNKLLQSLSDEFNNPLQKECLLLQVLSYLEKNQFHNHGSGCIENKVEQLLEWLKHNFTEEIDWEKTSAQFDVPSRTLYRYIKNQTGYTPQLYVSKLRLAHAYYQLRYTDKNITDIAYESGFNDSGYFSTCFKHEFGIKPMELRKTS